MTTENKDSAEYLVKQLLNNSILIVLARMVGIITLIVSVPFVIEHLGMEGYGVWETLLSIASITAILQTVISGTLLWRISVSYGVRDVVETQRIVRIGIGATLLSVIIFVPIIWMVQTPVLTFLQVPKQWLGTTNWILPTIIAIFLLGGINQTLAMVITGYQQAGFAALIQSIGLVVTNLTAIGLLIAGYKLPAMVVGYIAGFIFMFILLFPVAKRLCGHLILQPTLPSQQEVAILAPFVGLLLLSNLSYMLRDQTDKIILSSMASPEVTGYFSIAQRLSSIVMQSHVVIIAPFTAAIGALHARQDFSGIEDFYTQIGSWIAVLAGLVTIILSALRQPFFILWLGKNPPEAHSFLAFLLLGLSSAIIFAGAATALAKGVGQPGLETRYTFLTLLVVLSTKPILIFIFGPIGSVASSAIGWSVGALYMLFLVHRRLALPTKMIGRYVGIFIVTLTMATLGWFLGLGIPTPVEKLWLSIFLIVVASILAGLYLIILILLGLIDININLKNFYFPLLTKLARWKA